MKTQTAKTNNRQYAEATTNIYVAITALMQAQIRNVNAWIEVQQNGEQQFPVKIKNPALNNPFSWQSSYAFRQKTKKKTFSMQRMKT